MPGSLGHLSRRFFDVLFSRPLDVAERATVESWLPVELHAIYFTQQPADQRHSYEAALSVIGDGQDESDVVIAALLHDVGKRHARLGVIGRTFASLLILTGLPLTRRMEAYRDHAIIGARDLASVGAPSLAVDYALHHHGRRPSTIAPAVWDALEAADEPAKVAGPWSGGITSPQ